MKNVIDQQTGVVQPSVFLWMDTFAHSIRKVRARRFILAFHSGIAVSSLLGGEFTLCVRSPEGALVAGQESASASPRALLFPPCTVQPRLLSIGVIEALSRDRDLPARLSLAAYFTIVSGGQDGRLATQQDNFVVKARETQLIEATIASMPPSLDVCLSANEWSLIEMSALLRVWMRVECFRFLGIGDYEHTARLSLHTPKGQP